MSNKNIESEIMDQTKSRENERLKQEIVSLGQQRLEMYRVWASEMPPPPFSTIDPTNILSFSPKLQGQFSAIGYAPQHAPESISSQKNLNVSITHSLDLQYKSSTSIAPSIVSASVAPPSTEVSILAFDPAIVSPQSSSKSMFNTLDDHYYTPEPTSILVGPPKFLTKKSDMTEEQEKMARKMKSTEKAMKNSQGIANYEDVAHKDGNMSSSVNLPSSLKISKFEKHDRHEDFVKHLEQSRAQEVQLNNIQSQFRACTSNSYAHMQQGSSSQNSRYFVSLPQYPLNNAQLYAHPFFYPQWHAPVPQHHPGPPHIYQRTSKSKFQSRPEFAKRRKSKNNFTLIEESYASLFQRIIKLDIITPLLECTPDPHLRNFDPHVRCAYHSDILDHSIEDCRALKREIERMI
ncbi:hypothetical protein P3S68_010284 [Capsicum galapagoense]